MEATRKEEVLAAENRLRDYMTSEADRAEQEIMELPSFQGIMVTLALDMATSGLPQAEALSTLLGMGYIIGRNWEDSEFQDILEDFPSGDEIQEFWQEAVDEAMAEAQRNLLMRKGEEDE